MLCSGAVLFLPFWEVDVKPHHAPISTPKHPVIASLLSFGFFDGPATGGRWLPEAIFQAAKDGNGQEETSPSQLRSVAIFDKPDIKRPSTVA